MTTPCFSFCPNPGKKSADFVYKSIDYFKGTYSYEDIFESKDNVTMTINEVHTVWNGRCYTFCQMEKKNRLRAFIYLNKSAGTDVDVITHAPGISVLKFVFVFI
jgi:hypothetical protein